MRWLARIGVVIAVVGLCTHGRPAGAQHEEIPPGAIPPTPVNPYAHVVTTNASEAPPTEFARPMTWRDAACPACAGLGNDPPRFPIANHFHVWCWSHHNMLTCSSFCSDYRFLWGGCRSFFGEPCLNAPPKIPVPPGYGGVPLPYP